MTLSPYERAYTQFNNRLDHILTSQLNARKLFSKVTTLPEGTFKMDYTQISQMGDATVSWDIPDSQIARDGLEMTPLSVRLGVITRGWELEYSKWKAFQNKGVNLPMEYQDAAARKVAEKEETMLITSWKPNGSTAKIEGLYTAAAHSVTDTLDLATPGKAIEAVGAGKAILRQYGVKGVNMNWTIANTQYSQLETSKMPYTGDMEIDTIKKMLNDVPGAAPGEIYWSTELTAGTGFMSPNDPDGLYMELLIGTEARTVLGYDSKIPDISPLFGTTYEVVGPHYIHDECVVDFTGL